MQALTISALATALALGLMTPADAEDWTGAHLTFGISASSTDMHEDDGLSSPTSSGDDIAPYVAAGYDWAFNGVTLGVLGDFDFGGVENDDMLSQGKGLYGESDWFATLRARVGVPVGDRVQVYASGGLAWMRAGATGVDYFGTPINADSQTLTGPVVGLGAEFALAPGRHLTVEAVYADFGESDRFDAWPYVDGTLDPIVTAVRVGFTFRF